VIDDPETDLDQCFTRFALLARTPHEELPAFGDKFQSLLIRQRSTYYLLTPYVGWSEQRQGNYQTFEQASLPEHCVPSPSRQIARDDGARISHLQFRQVSYWQPVETKLPKTELRNPALKGS
jgi:hypothetical protein